MTIPLRGVNEPTLSELPLFKLIISRVEPACELTLIFN